MLLGDVFNSLLKESVKKILANMLWGHVFIVEKTIQ